MARPHTPPHVAIVGAGVAGLAAARVLAARGAAVVVFDKGRAPGGRLATRRDGDATFDHGAPDLEARSPAFAAALQGWAAAGVLAPTVARRVQIAAGKAHPVAGVRWVGRPTQSALARHLAAGLDVRTGVRVGGIDRRDGWRIRDDTGAPLGAFDAVVLALPGPQAVPLLDASPSLAAAAAAARYDLVLTGLATFTAPVPVPWDDATVEGGPLGRLVREGGKPDRPPGERWVLHAQPAWSAAHADAPPEVTAAALADAFSALSDVRPTALTVHRWRYARVVHPAPAAWDDRGLALTGDTVSGGGLEDAFLAGRATADRLSDQLALSKEISP